MNKRRKGGGSNDTDRITLPRVANTAMMTMVAVLEEEGEEEEESESEPEPVSVEFVEELEGDADEEKFPSRDRKRKSANEPPCVVVSTPSAMCMKSGTE